MKKQVSLKLLLIIVIVLVIIFCVILLYITKLNSRQAFNTEYDTIDIQYGDCMNGFSVKDAYGNSYDNLPVSSSPTILFYLSSTCSSCANVLADFERIEGVLGSKYFLIYSCGMIKFPVKSLRSIK